jgi:hypothetical protein
MLKRREFYIGKNQRKGLMQLMMDVIGTYPDGTKLIIEEAGKSRMAEKKYHAMIGDIALQCRFNGELYSAQSWKRLLVEAFANLMRIDAEARGLPDPFPEDVELIDGLDHEIIALGTQTRKFTREQADNFIEYLFAYGADRGVAWREPAQRVIREMLDRKTASS